MLYVQVNPSRTSFVHVYEVLKATLVYPLPVSRVFLLYVACSFKHVGKCFDSAGFSGDLRKIDVIRVLGRVMVRLAIEASWSPATVCSGILPTGPATGSLNVNDIIYLPKFTAHSSTIRSKGPLASELFRFVCSFRVRRCLYRGTFVFSLGIPSRASHRCYFKFQMYFEIALNPRKFLVSSGSWRRVLSRVGRDKITPGTLIIPRRL